MSEWKEYKLEEVGLIVTGSTPSTSIKEYWEGDIPFYSPADFTGNLYCQKTEKSVSEKAYKLSRGISANTIMFACIASIGKMALSLHPGLTNQQINSIMPYSWFDYRYVYYMLLFSKSKFINLAPQTTIPIINKTDFSNFSFLFPPLSHQRKIARILTTVDNIIEKTEAAIAKYKAIKQGMMHDLFTRGIDVKTGKLRPRFEDAPELYKETELGWIPKEWEVKRLDELAKDCLKNGYFKKPEYVGWGYKLINVSDLYQPYEIDINQKDVQRVYATTNDYSKYEVQVGDLFFTRSSLVLEGIAHCNIVLNLPEPSVWECHVVRLRPDKQKISPEYLGFYCTTYEARLFFMSIAKQVTMTTISQPDIAKLPVCAPTNINEQKEIAKRLRSIDKHIRNEETSKLKYQKLKSGLMQDLLTGKKEVAPDPEDYANDGEPV